MTINLNISIPGVELKHLKQASVIGAVAGALRLGTRLLPVALMSSHPIHVAVSTALGTLALLPCIEKRPLCKANIERLWKRVPYHTIISLRFGELIGLFNPITQPINERVITPISSRLPEVSEQNKNIMKRVLEGSVYLAAAAALSSVGVMATRSLLAKGASSLLGVAVLPVKSYKAVFLSQGPAFAACELVALGALRMNDSLQGHKLGG